MRTRKASSAAGLVAGPSAAFVLAAPGTALATHTHVMQVGSGQCVVLAEDAGEESVVLPAAVFQNNPNVDIPANAGRTLCTCCRGASARSSCQQRLGANSPLT